MKHTLLLPLLLFTTLCHAQQVDATVEFPSKDWLQPFPVNITINKESDVVGFAKAQLVCNPRFKVSPLDREGGTFTYDNGNIKVLWMDAPAKKVLNLTLLVTVPSDMTSGEVTMSGAFYYMNNEGEPSSAVIQQKRFQFNQYGGGELASTTPPAKKDRKAEEKRQPVQQPRVEQQPTKAPIKTVAPEPEPPAPKPEPQRRSETLTPKPEPVAQAPAPKPKPISVPASTSERVIFRAQLAAQKRYEVSTTVGRRLGINDEVVYDQHQDWHKYTTGEFSNYRAAKVFANGLRETSQVPGSFVVGFENGERITIQRAIELTK